MNNCPSYARFRIESYSCGGRLWLIRAWINGVVDLTDHLSEIIYTCTLCKNCEVKCPFSFNEHIVDMVIAARREIIDIGKVPKGVKNFLKNVLLYKNPYGIKRSKRDVWREGLLVEDYRDQEYLFYVGCTGSFDPKGQRVARAVSKLFLHADLSFGILGKKEICDGNEVFALGEEGLFEELVKENLELFDRLKVKKIITLSPHSYNAFKNLYTKYGARFEVYHYTHILLELLRSERIRVKKGFDLKVTYHDPCFLGRWNKEYKAPREVLKYVLEKGLLEMERSHDSSLCCGGGSGNFYMDLLGGSKDSPARIRVREAHKIGADVIAVSCPKCLIMLDDAVTAESVEGNIKVLDIAEIVESCVIGG